jgi:hypothetical protein
LARESFADLVRTVTKRDRVEHPIP